MVCLQLWQRLTATKAVPYLTSGILNGIRCDPQGPRRDTHPRAITSANNTPVPMEGRDFLCNSGVVVPYPMTYSIYL